MTSRPRTSEKASRFTESVIREMTRLAHKYDAVRMKSWPSEIAIVLRQYGEQSSSSEFEERISNFGPALKTVVRPASSVVT